jgi:hypothetical protein
VGKSDPVEAGFAVVIDTAEQNAWRFVGLKSDADKQYREIIVPTVRQSLGRHPNSNGDYSILGCEGRVAIERKAKEDAWGTILGWATGHEADHQMPGRRERFEAELGRLNEFESAVVIVEATLGTLVAQAPSWGVKPVETNGKIFLRSVISYQQRFPRVQWVFADTPRMAEGIAFRWLDRFWRKVGKDGRERS